MVRILAFVVAVLLSGCGSSSGGGGGNGSTINITGKLTNSSSLTRSAWDENYLVGRLNDGDPLVGFKLYCVTFTSSPVSASAVAGSDGSVTLSLAAGGVAFGCFILDTSGNQIAAVAFKGSSTSGSAATFSGDAALGAISVNTQTGFAQATLTSDTNVVTKTPSTVACPLGTFAVDLGVGFSDCTTYLHLPSELTGSIVVSQDANGYHVALSAYPGKFRGYQPAQNGQPEQMPICGHFSQQGKNVTFTNNTLSFSWDDSDSNGQTSCTRTTTITAKPSADCTTATVHISESGCSSCDGATPVSACRGCGSTTCDEGTYTATRQ